MAAATNRLILVIDDDEMSRRSLARALHDSGYEVIESPNGQDGLTAAREHHPDAIICDNIMPIMHGTDLLSLLRQDSWGRDVPFILLTADYDVEAVNESLSAGKTDFMIKDDTSLADISTALARYFTD